MFSFNRWVYSRTRC